ncbi:class GN sortase [Marinihelvus fidelis]|uniref:class GN sortase n=1 Tax=Marinihelvus fidelis TaxID=2613842 RepID=UPI001CD60FB3|nr:class GN sortase [Marinihelvus fidelis]
MNPRRLCAAALAVAALFLLAQAAWIPAKAWLGQRLLEAAWHRVQSGEPDARPWPWADTSPVAELAIPRLGLHQLVVEGASGRNLAWAPAALTPVTGGDIIISAHRDTHFSALRHALPGDLVTLRTPTGERRYRITHQEVIDSRDTELVIDPSGNRLTLVTCWPFDAVTAGGPMRWVINALPA